MIESTIVNEWMAEAKAEALLVVLEARFGPVISEVKTNIEKTTAPRVIQGWFTLAMQANSLDEFRQSAGL